MAAAAAAVGGRSGDRQRRRRLVHTRGVQWAAPATVGRRADGKKKQSMYSEVVKGRGRTATIKNFKGHTHRLRARGSFCWRELSPVKAGDG